MTTLLVAADFCPRDRVAELIENKRYDAVFGEVKPIIEQCDYSIVNLECPIRTTKGDGIKKAGPSLKCSAQVVDALSYAGFDCVTLANNHFYDQGEQGVRETIDALNTSGIAYVGGGVNIDEAGRVFFKKINDITIAFINCCEHEWSIVTETTGGSNPLHIIKQYNDIQEARKKADYVIVIIHGGIEHFQYPSPRMVETYRFFVDVGADAVINHHQHCFSGGETYKGKPIFYGLGNFCFDWQEKRSKLWDEGYMVKLYLNRESIEYELIPYIQNNKIPGVHVLYNLDYTEWKERYDDISNTISSSKHLLKKYNELKKRTRRKYSIYITPYAGRVALALYMRNLLPLFLSKNRLRELLNMIMCESHVDRFKDMLNYMINKNEYDND